MKFSYFQLPHSICVDVFTHWIDSKDLARLDTALVNKQQRQYFLEIIKDDHFVLRGSDALVLPSYLDWLCARGLKVDGVVITSRSLLQNDLLNQLDVSKVVSLSLVRDHGGGGSASTSGSNSIGGNGGAISGASNSSSSGMIGGSVSNSVLSLDFFTKDVYQRVLTTLNSSILLVGGGATGNSSSSGSGNGGSSSSHDPLDCYKRLFIRCSNLERIDFGNVADPCFGQIGMFCAKLQSIRAVDCKGLTDSAVENIAQHCRGNIRSVVLRACESLTSASVFAIAQNCPNVTHIDVSYGGNLSERCLLELADSCSRLEWINFEGIKNISDAVIERIALNCPSLEYFNIDYYKGMSHAGIDPVALRLIAERCSRIKDFIAYEFHYKKRQEVSFLKLKGSYTRVPRLMGIIENCPADVSALHVSECKRFDNNCLALAATRFREHLKALTMRQCDKVTGDGFAQLIQHCTSLAHVDMSQTTLNDENLVGLASMCPQLRSLYISKCENVTDTGVIQALAAINASDPEGNNRRNRNRNSQKEEQQEEEQEAERHLVALDVSHCARLTDTAMQAVITHAPHLQLLDINGCSAVTHAMASAIAVELSDLVHLGLGSSSASVTAHISYYRDQYPDKLIVGPNGLSDRQRKLYSKLL
mmetsp:Transcript_3812/g.5961  ORF Transcript_3812/g.5961 Transcript_3812/m.5961 type:complete len:646 (-) Transcript_3812:277-2214(-)|eukprot:CAMPEP_0174971166 /NCGR_PEP_ID=MMETSP0004_2-20121128/9826_1 /TAXON_ID=420556 /ORGANISM="Ochromonas sp., Strain CCMP1393" /LENGTH=645 /DNA_ID=CAMNT_0016221055 /DNA_START=176 /DNA_END=2113 /DNA_ORIENTATION=+